MVAMSCGIAHGMRVPAWQIGIGWKALLRQPAREGHRDNSHQKIAFRQRRRTHAPVNRMLSRGASLLSRRKHRSFRSGAIVGEASSFGAVDVSEGGAQSNARKPMRFRAEPGRKLRTGPQPSLLKVWSFARVRNRRCTRTGDASASMAGRGEVSPIRCGRFSREQ